VLRGGRVIDPESGLDAVRDVAISNDQVTAIGETLPPSRLDLDVTGQVVTAGFIDIHSHAHDRGGQRLQAMDGVTTALELEAGITPVAAAYEQAARTGRVVNYGFAASWAMARMEALAGVPLDGGLAVLFQHMQDPRWQRAATPADIDRILARLEADLADGALGIGILAGYVPGADPAEYLRVAALAARAAVPTYTHSRDLAEFTPNTLADGAEEIVRAAAETGAHMHYCHVNSTTVRHAERVLGLIGRAQRAGSRVTTEAYPYGAGMTGIGAAFLAPERLSERGLVPPDLTYAPTGERVADAARLRELRATDPGGLAVIRFLNDDDPADRELLLRYVLFPGAVVASDAMPLTWSQSAQPEGRGAARRPGRPGGRGTAPAASLSAGTEPGPDAWPLPAQAFTHPRTAGTFGRALRLLTRDGGPLNLAEALAKCSLGPARLLEGHVPAMRRKGRVAAGADADLVVFDPATITDQATYTASTRTTTGIRHVLVNGTFVVRDTQLARDALPGRPVRAPR